MDFNCNDVGAVLEVGRIDCLIEKSGFISVTSDRAGGAVEENASIVHIRAEDFGSIEIDDCSIIALKFDREGGEERCVGDIEGMPEVGRDVFVAATINPPANQQSDG